MINEQELALLNQGISDIKLLLAELEAVASALHHEQQHEAIEALQSLDDEQYASALQDLKHEAMDIVNHTKASLEKVLNRR